MKEKQTNEYYLPDDDPETFELLTYFIYRQSFPDDYRVLSGATEHYLLIARFYILSDKLLLAKEAKIVALNALAITRLHRLKFWAKKADRGAKWAKGAIASRTVNRVLHSTAEDCPLRKMFMEYMWQGFVFDENGNYLAECFEGLPFSQVCKCLELVKGAAASGLRSEPLPSLAIAERGESIADCPDYQVGFLKPN